MVSGNSDPRNKSQVIHFKLKKLMPNSFPNKTVLCYHPYLVYLLFCRSAIPKTCDAFNVFYLYLGFSLSVGYTQHLS